MRHTRWLALLLPLALIGCEPTGEADLETDTEAAAEMTDPAAAEQAVDQLRNDWVRRAEAGDAAGAADLYADDAVMVGPSGEIAEGGQAIQEALAPGFEALSSLEVTSTGTEVGTDLVADMGTFTQTLQTDQGEQTVTGHYLVILRKQSDGSWKIVQHLSAAPPPAEN